MKKSLDNIYNNNFKFTNNLILKRRKQNQYLIIISLTLILFITLFSINLLNKKKITKEEILFSHNNAKNSSEKNKEDFNKTQTSNRYFASSINFYNMQNKSKNKEQKSFNFLNFAKISFLTEICFEKAAFFSSLGRKLNNDDEYFLFIYLVDDLMYYINDYFDSRVICFNENSNKISLKIQNQINPRYNDIGNFFDIQFDVKDAFAIIR